MIIHMYCVCGSWKKFIRQFPKFIIGHVGHTGHGTDKLTPKLKKHNQEMVLTS